MVPVTEKPVIWEGTSKEDMSAFSEAVRQDAGFALWQVQQGVHPPNSKALALVGQGVHEIRISDGDAYRVIYIAKLPEAVYVLHAFQKKAKSGIATPKPELDLAQSRLKTLMQRRKAEGKQ